MSHPDQARRLGGAIGWGVTARLLRLLLGLVGTALVLRLLGSFNYGILAQVRTVLAFGAVVVGAGLGQGLLRYLPAWWLAEERGRIRRSLAFTFGVHAVVWLVLVAVIWTLRPLLVEWTHEYTAPVLVLGVFLLLPEVVALTAVQVANAFYDTRTVSFAVVVSSLVYVTAVALVLPRGGGIAGVLLAAGVSNLVLALILLARVPTYLRLPPPSGERVTSEVPGFRKALRYSFPFVAIGILNLITWRQSEVLLLGHFLGAREAGFFDIAYRLPQTVLEFVPGAIWPLVMAGASEAYHRNPTALQRTASAYYKLLFLLVAPLAVGGFLVGDLMVRVLGGAEFAEAGIYAQVMFLVISVSFFATPLSMVFYVVERPDVGLALYVVNAVVNVGLDLLLIPRLGIWGAVIPVGVVIAASPFVNLWMLRRMGIRIVPPGRFLLRIHLAAALMLLLWPLRPHLTGTGGLLVLVLAGVVLFLVGLRLFRVFGPDERDLVRRAGPRVWALLAPVVGGGRNP